METVDVLKNGSVRSAKKRGPAVAVIVAMFTSLFVLVPAMQAGAAPLTGISAVASGAYGTCALTTAGGVKCWGYNFDGELGNGTTQDRTVPVNVSGLSMGVTQIDGGNSHFCALTTAGGVKCWGRNDRGQVGDGTLINKTVPVNVSGLTSGVVAVSSGGSHTCALTTTGAVKCWGYNFHGQVGDGTNTDRTTPVSVLGLSSGVAAISAGLNHTCALLTTGGVKCWGRNGSGQLGNDTLSGSLSPVSVAGLVSVAAVSSGYNHTCALTTSGGVKCWGYNDDGQLGDGTKVTTSSPVDVEGLSAGVAVLSSGGDHSCVLTVASAVKCWGYNFNGQLGDGKTTSSAEAVGVSGLTSGIAAISSGGAHSCAVTTGGVIKCWGDDEYGQLGNGVTSSRTKPLDPTGLGSGIARVSTGTEHTCALTASGGVKCWGHNPDGELGDGTRTSSYVPVKVSGLASGVSSIGTSGYHTCALTTGGSVKCWGWNDFGQLGDGTTLDSSQPVPVFRLSSGVKAIAVGDYHTCALTTAGAVKCWGYNSYGQLGDGTLTNRLTPITVPGLSGVTAIKAGSYHTCALLNTGTVKCWGYNTEGELGDGTTIERLTPVTVSGLSGATSVSAGGAHTCVRTNAGTVKCWGYNVDGQLGDGTTINRLTPVSVLNLSGAVEVQAGGSHTCARVNSGGLKCWGYNGYGQIGDGTFISRSAPVNVFGLSSGIAAIATGGYDTCSVTSSGAVKCWGYNGYGQLGVNPGWTPVKVLVGPVARYTLSISKSGTGTGTVTSSVPNIDCGSVCSAVYDAGTVVTIIGSPSMSSAFIGWSGGGCSGTFACAVTMSQAKSVTATFAPLAYKPDALISGSSSGPFIGDNIYNTTGNNQTVSTSIAPGSTKTFFVKIQNDGNAPDPFTLVGSAGNADFTVSYFRDVNNITADVVAGTYSTGFNIAVGGSITMRIVIQAAPGVLSGTSKAVLLTVVSENLNTKKDAVKATVSV